MPKVLRKLHYKHPILMRAAWGGMAALMLFTVLTSVFSFKQTDDLYHLSSKTESLIGETNPLYARALKFDAKEQVFQYNQGYAPGGEVIGESGAPKFSASFSKEPEKGTTITDPTTKTSVGIKPDFGLRAPIQDDNRLIYPIKGRNASKIFTLEGTGIKEDIILHEFQGNEADFIYNMELPDGTEARLEADGSIGVYGVNSFLLGSVSTGSDKDAELLEQARKNGKKSELLFRFPAPYIVERSDTPSKAKARFSLKGTELVLHATDLHKATYPLSIDPSVYVETAAKLMRGNNETNVEFDVTNELIQKGTTTGARFGGLQVALTMPAARFAHATVVTGGYIYVIGGNNGPSNQQTVYWAKLDPTTHNIVTANPGDGSCGSSWCTNTAYNLPATRSAHTAVAYNGFLYVFGGRDASCSGGTLNSACDTTYIAKLGANGEPMSWHPTDTNPANWVHWYSGTTLTTARSFPAAVAYSNRMYLLGGRNGTSTGGVTTVEYADINPTGTLSSWSTTGMTALPSARFGHNVHVYNDRMYLVGGKTGASTILGTVNYIKIKSDGSMESSWLSANSFSTARFSWGGTFSTIWGGYLYVGGGCTAAETDTNGECTTATGGQTAELASINADGSLASWGSINDPDDPVTIDRFGASMVAWRDTIYVLGGCQAQNLTSSNCSTTLNNTRYSKIKQDGDASTVATSTDNTQSPCNTGTPTNCDLPSVSNIGHMLSATVVLNGYLYIIGGCTSTTSTCTTASGNTIYAAIESDGDLSRPSVCTGGTAVDSWCVDSTNPISGGITASGTTVFNGRIYLVGGQAAGSLKGNIYHVGVSSDGSLDGTWTTQSFANVAATSVSYTFAYARANPSSSTIPGNLYIFGGCSGSATGAGCPSGSNTDDVFKCNILPSGSLGDGTNGAADCSVAGQQQIGTVPGATGTGLALHAGTVYANYIYLIGGVAPGLTDLATVRYAKFNNNNDVVAVSGFIESCNVTAPGNTWVESCEAMSVGRRRGTSFGYNGYLYAVGGYDASQGGVLSDIQFTKINVSDGSLGAFSVSGVTINQRWGLSVPVSSSYAFVIGGCTAGASPTCTNGAMTDIVQIFQIYNNESGSPVTYSNGAAQYPTDRIGVSAAIHNGYIYVAGGCTSTSDCTDATNDVQYASLDPSSGAIGTWQSATGDLPADRAFGQLEVAGGTLYYIGGQGDAATDERTEVYYATPSSGNIASWTSTTALPAARAQHSATVWNGRIYVTGGLDGSATAQPTVYASSDQSAGGAVSSWTTTGMTAFNVARSGHTIVAYANNLYLMGGYGNSRYLNDVQFAKIDGSGTIGSWTYTTSLPTAIRNADGFAANGYIYLIGGRSSSGACVSNSLVAPVSANTAIDPYDTNGTADDNLPTGVGEWYETNVRYNGSRYGAAVAYNGGKYYVLGGACASATAPTVAAAPATTSFATDTTSYTINLPAGIAAGDLLLLFFSIDNNAGNTSVINDPDGAGTGWESQATQVSASSGVRGYVWAKVATGSEGATVAFTGTSESGAAQVYRIPAANWYGSLAGGVSVATGTGAITQTPNPPSLDPSWDLENALWFAYVAGGTYTSITTPPTNYANGVTTSGNTGANGASVSTVRRTNLVSSEDPVTFTMNASFTSIPFTVAVRPHMSYVTGTSQIQQTAVLSQPQIARYSRMIDTDTDVFPTKWLLNGVDNSIGARWFMRYRSSTAATASWGQETAFGDVTLAQPEVFTPLNGAGTNTNFARYYYLAVTIDSSQSYGYPDDVTRGPTIADMSLFFTSDPSKRLRHGKTFTGGEQQPLDTPF